jgi:hypothetical protein
MHRRAQLVATCVAVLLACAVVPTVVVAAAARAPHRAATRCVTRATSSRSKSKQHAASKRTSCAAAKAAAKQAAAKKKKSKKGKKKKRKVKASAASSRASAPISWTGWNVLSDPIDPTQQTDVPWGTRSDWLQPWRAYLDTRPASMMRNALGINFNVPSADAPASAQFLGQVGFKRARVEIGWSAMSYSDPSQLANPAEWDTTLGALKASGIRPLILLNANDGAPGPEQTFSAQITQPAAAGATTVQVSAATAQQIVPGLTGFNGPTGTAALYIATSVSPAGLVTLSQPLPVAVPAGTYPATTLRYQPFASPSTPAFAQTLSGWLLYVQAVTAEARKVLGNDNFDVEVWNELGFGSDFLNIGNYYNPVPAALQGTGNVDDQLLASTVAWLRDPANGASGVGIGDGFANEDPTVSGSTVPNGVTAIDRHPYYGGIVQMPGYAGSVPQESNVSAGGQSQATNDASGTFTWPWLPTYTSFFPEYFLTAISTNYLERDLSPITTTIGNVSHGRKTKPAGAGTPPQVWVTETGFRPNQAGGMTSAQTWHVQAKSALRTLSSFVNKGVTALDFYSLDDGDWSMVDPTQAGGGPTMVALHRFMQAFAGPSTIAESRSLSLNAVADQGNPAQFAGNGTAAHPALDNRDVVAFLPFQTDSHRFVIPAYVMTRNMAQSYSSNANSVTRYDLPAETYRLEVGGLDTSKLHASATDPMTGDSVPVSIVGTSGNNAVIQMPLTDSPRLLVLTDG